MAANSLAIANQALIFLGAGGQLLSALDTTTQNGTILSELYATSVKALQQTYPWKFCISRVAITVDGTAPAFGRAYRYALPADFLSLLPPYPEDNRENLDWIVEGAYILTDDSTPLNLRYVASITTTTLFHALFDKAAAALLALEACEQICQSNTRFNQVKDIFAMYIQDARIADAILKVNHLPPPDEWVLGRIQSRNNTRSFYA